MTLEEKEKHKAWFLDFAGRCFAADKEACGRGLSARQLKAAPASPVARAGAAGVVAGAQAPVILASRADSRETLMHSIALALVSMEANTTGGV